MQYHFWWPEVDQWYVKKVAINDNFVLKMEYILPHVWGTQVRYIPFEIQFPLFILYSDIAYRMYIC